MTSRITGYLIVLTGTAVILISVFSLACVIWVHLFTTTVTACSQHLLPPAAVAKIAWFNTAPNTWGAYSFTYKTCDTRSVSP